MRWVTCSCCGYHGSQIVFDNYIICQTCRMMVLTYWTDVLGLNFRHHPFIDEFIGVETTRMRNLRLRSYEVSSESSELSDNQLDLGELL